MSLWAWYQAGFCTSLVMAMLSVLLGGTLPVQLWGALLVVAVMMPLRLERKYLPGWLGTLLGLGGLLWAGLILRNMGMEAAVLAAGVALMVITLARLMTAATLKHDGQLLLLTLLLMFSGSVLHTEVTYGLVSLGYAVAMVWALVTRQLVVGAGMESKRLGGIREEVTLNRRDIITGRFLAVVAALSIFIVFSTGVLFVTFPRMGLKNLGLFARGASSVPGSVSLQDRPRGETGSGTAVARIYGLSLSQFEGGLYLRGPVYDELLASGFKRGQLPVQKLDAGIAQKPNSGEFVYEVFSHPLGLPILPSLGPVQEARVIYGGQSNPSLRLKVTGVDLSSTLVANRTPTGPIRYRVRGGLERIGQYVSSGKPDVTEYPAGIDYFLKLPDRIDSRLVTTASELVEGKQTSIARVEAIRRFLQNGFTYTLEQPNRDKPDPLAAFLFEDRRGHCEYFATAFAALLRGAGIPSRVVGGYQGGLWDDESEVAVFTGKHAHVWVEWFEPGRGWWAVDATPLALETPGYLSGVARFYEKMSRAWDEYVVELGLREQFNLFTGVFITVRDTSRKLSGWPLRLMVAFSLLAFGVLFLWRYQDKLFKRGVARDKLGYALELAIVRLSGSPVDFSMSLREAMQRLEDSEPVLEGALEVYESRRFGQRSISKKELSEMLKALKAVR
ncbi:MAG: transglutaminase domain-containing protein [Deltaproteobacteria bacterium]|nr:transglutaminase domain-containing protein [Deltaproteobacteria bacterium]